MRDDTIPVPAAPDRPWAASARGDLNPDLIRTDWWADEMLARADIPVVDIPFVSIGGGIGSFVMVDYLRICGVPTSAIRVFTQLETTTSSSSSGGRRTGRRCSVWSPRSMKAC